jgi:hypothetical protein
MMRMWRMSSDSRRPAGDSGLRPPASSCSASTSFISCASKTMQSRSYERLEARRGSLCSVSSHRDLQSVQTMLSCVVWGAPIRVLHICTLAAGGGAF